MYKMLLKQNICYFSGTGTENFSLLISENGFINFLPVSQNMNYLHLDSNSTCNGLGLIYKIFTSTGVELPSQCPHKVWHYFGWFWSYLDKVFEKASWFQRKFAAYSLQSFSRVSLEFDHMSWVHPLTDVFVLNMPCLCPYTIDKWLLTSNGTMVGHLTFYAPYWRVLYIGWFTGWPNFWETKFPVLSRIF